MRALLATCLLVLAFGTACTGKHAASKETAGSDASRPRTGLHRPFDLPAVAPGAPCPATRGGQPNPDAAFALGSGPAYPVLGYEGKRFPPDPKAFVPLADEDRKGKSYWHKTLWEIDPKYDGPVLVRGRGLDPPQPIYFGIPAATPGGVEEQVRELRFRAEDSASWRYGPSFTILPGPGCYGFQVDGTSFSNVLVFEAARAST